MRAKDKQLGWTSYLSDFIIMTSMSWSTTEIQFMSCPLQLRRTVDKAVLQTSSDSNQIHKVPTERNILNVHHSSKICICICKTETIDNSQRVT